MPKKKSLLPGKAHCIYLPHEIERKLSRYLHKNKTTLSAVIQEALDKVLNEGNSNAQTNT